MSPIYPVISTHIKLKTLFLMGSIIVHLSGCGGGGGVSVSGGGDGTVGDDGTDGGTDGPTGLFSDFQEADGVIGQANFSSNLPNQGGAPDANTLDLPNGRVAEGSLYVPDPVNNRILGFNDIPAINNANADFVLGQPDFSSNGSGLSNSELSFPSDTWVDGAKLFAVDFFNNRVLIWNTLPSTNMPADIVVGQPDFDTGGPPAPTTATTAASFRFPISVAAAGNKLFVADRDNHRVLIWNAIPTSNGVPADVVLGQSDFAGSTATVSQSGLRQPRSVWSDGQRLIVSDSGNNRVLIWNSVPITNGLAADVVIGQTNFNTATRGESANGLSNPRAVYSDGTRLLIADRDNNRVLIYSEFPTANNVAADIVIGQSNFTNNAPNDDDQDGTEDSSPTARTLSGVTGVFFTAAEQLVVTDRENNRVLIFDAQ